MTLRIAYLTSQYPATSHTFIRREVTALRASGVDIQTFSVRAPGAAELKSAVDRDEAARTFTLLAQSPFAYIRAHLGEAARHPLRYVRTLVLALRHRPPGGKAALLALAHFAEAMVLATELRRRGSSIYTITSPTAAPPSGYSPAGKPGIGWSFTIHGISEFDYPAGLLLGARSRQHGSWRAFLISAGLRPSGWSTAGNGTSCRSSAAG
jgi:colanic acid/amylovoran biosynthesis glycosyltransferase